MKRLQRILLKTSLTLVFIYGALVIAFNSWLPLGLHVGIAAQKSFRLAPDWEGRFYDLLTWRSLSMLVVNNDKNKCDMPFFVVEKKGGNKSEVIRYFSNGTRTQGSNLRLAHLITYRNDANHNREAIDKLLAESLPQCNPNGGTIAENDYSPLNSAIAKKEVDIVEALLRRDVATNVVLKHPKKPIDGMSSAQFARFLEAKTKNEDSRSTYKKIAEMIEAYDAKAATNR
jgi:hypothetical protein